MRADGTLQILPELRIEPNVEEHILSIVCPKCASVVENQRPFPSLHCGRDCYAPTGFHWCPYMKDCAKVILQHKIDCPAVAYLKEGRPDIKWDELTEYYLSREISPANEVALRARGNYYPPQQTS